MKASKTRPPMAQRTKASGRWPSVCLDSELVLDKEMALDDTTRLSFLGGRLSAICTVMVGRITAIFPNCRRLIRFDTGLDVLEKDHADLDVVLDDFTGGQSRDQAGCFGRLAFDEAGAVHARRR